MMGMQLAQYRGGVCHDLNTTLHRLDELGLSHGEYVFDTALAAYDLNPSQSDYPVSKLATNFLGLTVEDGDAGACAEAVWLLRSELDAELKKQGMESLYYDMELPLCSVLFLLRNSFQYQFHQAVGRTAL